MKFRQVSSALLLPFVALTLWQTLASQAVIDPFLFPPPLTLLVSGGQMLRDGELAAATLTTLSRVASGFLLGSLTGVLCGLMMGTVAFLRHSLEPAISALFTTPKLALFPMVMLVFGLGETPGLILTATACFIVVSLHTLDAVRGVNRSYLETESHRITPSHRFPSPGSI